jgi:flagellar assembly protein FliH
MLSRVIPATDTEVQPVLWRSGDSTALPPLRAPAPPRPTAPPIVPSVPPPPSADFEAQVHQQLEASFEAGRQQGETSARQQLEHNVRRAVEQLVQAATEVAATRDEVLRRAESEVVQLSIEIARRILHRELSVDPTALSALVKAALDKLAGQQVSRVRVHPEQEAMVRSALAQFGRAADIEVVSDNAQPRGGAVFETEGGSSLDASVETQLREIERGLADRLQERA